MKLKRPINLKTDIDAIKTLDIYLNGKRNKKDILEDYSNYKGKLFVAEDFEDNVIAVVSVSANSPKKDKTFTIDHLAVLRTHRNLGIGRDLVAFIVEQTKEMGGRLISVQVADWNERAQLFYSLCGFKKRGVLEGEKSSFVWLDMEIKA